MESNRNTGATTGVRAAGDSPTSGAEANYHEIFDKANDAIFVHDAQTGEILSVNRRMTELYGVTPEEARSLGIAGLSSGVPPFTARAARHWGRRALTAGPQIFEWQARNKTGQLFWVEVNLKPATLDGVPRLLSIVRDISDRKLTELLLLEQRASFHELFNLEPDALILIDVETLRMVEMNDAAVELYGYSRAEFRQLRATDLSAEPEQTRVRIQTEDVGQVTRVPLRWHRKKDGTKFPVEIVGRVFELRGRRFRYVVIRDITERRRVDETLSFLAERGWTDAGEPFFPALVTHLAKSLNMEYALIARLLEDGRTAETVALYAVGGIASVMRYELAGTPSESVIGRTPQCYPRGVCALFPEALHIAEMQVESFAGVPLWDSHGKPLGLIAVMDRHPFRDARVVESQLQLVAARAAAELEREQVERTLRSGEERFRLLVETIPQLAWRMGPDGYTLECNARWHEYTGQTTAEARNHGWLNAVHPADSDRVIESLTEAMSSSRPLEVECRLRRAADQTFRWHLLRALPMRTEGGPVLAWFGTATDIEDLQQATQALREKEERYRAFVSQGAEGISRWETDLPVPTSLPPAEQVELILQHAYLAESNAAFAELHGGTRPEELIGMRLAKLLRPHEPQNRQAVLRFVENGYRAVEVEVYEADARGRTRCLSCGVTGVVEQGCLVRGWSVQRDITERKLQLQMQHAVSSILRRCLQTLSIQELLEQTLDEVFSIPNLNWQPRGCIFLKVAAESKLVLQAQRGLSPEMVARCRQVALGQCICGRAALDRQPVLLDHEHAAADPCQQNLPRHRHCCVPIAYEQDIFGLINLYLDEGRTITPQEEEFLTSVADALAGVFRRYHAEAAELARQSELLAAQSIQKHLLPNGAPQLAGFDIAAATEPAAHVAGDYFDYLHLPDQSLGVVVGDVSGHGLGPSLLAASAQTLLRVLADSHSDPSAMLTRANLFLERQTEDDRFVTLFFGRLDPRTRSFSYINAGHEPGFVLDATGLVKRALTSTTIPLGLMPDTSFLEAERVPLLPGDMILLLTDGVTEALSPLGVSFGSQRALDLVRSHRQRPAQEIVAELYRAVCQFTGHARLDDDATSVVLKVQP